LTLRPDGMKTPSPRWWSVVGYRGESAAIVLVPDEAAQRQRLFEHHHVPAHRHDGPLCAVGGGYQDHGARLQKASDIFDGEVFFL